jgi:hypothetical protein
VRPNHVSAAYGDELLSLGRGSVLRSLFAMRQWLAADDTLMIRGRMPLLCFGESELLLEQDDVATLTCLTGRAFLGEESFAGVARLQPGETRTSRPGKPPTQPGAG